MTNKDTTAPNFTVHASPSDASELLLVDLANADNSSVISMKRYIPYTSADSNKGEGEYDVIYEVICVVRQTYGETFSEETAQMLYGAANETLQKWYRIAASVWEGKPIPDNDEGFWNRQIQLTPRVGASNITVFGNVVDKEGRFVSLTITDQTDMKDIVRYMPYAMWFYNEVSELSRHDLSPYGVNPNNVRKTTVVDVEMKRNTKFDKSATNVAATTASNKGLPPPQPQPEVNSTPIVCESISDLRALPQNTLFEIGVGRAVWIAPRTEQDSGMMVLNSYSLDASGSPVLETKENVFMHGNRNGFDLLVSDFAKSGNPIQVGEEKKFEAPIKITGIKRIGTTGKPFYDKLRLA